MDANELTITVGAAITFVSGFIGTIAVVLSVFWRTVGRINGKLELYDHKFIENDKDTRETRRRLEIIEYGRNTSEVELGKMFVRMESLLVELSSLQSDVKKHLQAHAGDP